ncbi:hypothetical protein F7734_40115 [Scytonema sp. UIC 10036]|uniref:hypothetical protein n=1 Tax=Scytonema sp. UIC 10036 TaxID=2304196 RepID=UPI0012DA91D0|nr:hypothetical protein [Scytonema sp. UIC 10036]MUG98186.1 hypothetical protein [Scytonema sp. UIC 10036]
MTDSNDNSEINIEALLIQLARSHLTTQEDIQATQRQIRETQYQISQATSLVQSLTNDVDRVLARNAILNDVLLELSDSHETMKETFQEHQRTTNAALQALEAILVQLIGRSN